MKTQKGYRKCTESFGIPFVCSVVMTGVLDMSKYTDENIEKEDDTMSAVARNYVYEVKTKKADEKNEKIVSKTLLAACKKVASKYPKK